MASDAPWEDLGQQFYDLSFHNHAGRCSVYRSGDTRGNCLIVCPLPNCSIEECEKYSPLKYVKISVNKKQVSNNLIKNILKSIVCPWSVTFE